MLKPLDSAVSAAIGFMCGFFKPIERLLPSAWVQKNLRLPAESTETDPGKISFKTRPYLAAVIDDIADPEIQNIIWVAPTRTGKTFCLRMILAWVVCILRLPVLWYDATMPKARSVAQKELWPLIKSNKVLKDRLPKNRHDKTTTKILFPGSNFEMFGGNSAGQAAGETAAVVLGNETDKWQTETESEAGIIDLTRHRTESFPEFRKNVYSSTPTTESGPIWVEYLKTDQQKFFVPCPHCAHEQHLKFERVKWNPLARLGGGKWNYKLVRESARYHCESCNEPITQIELRAAVELGSWKPTAEGLPGYRGRHINGLYGPLPTNTMGQLAIDFLSARNKGLWTDRQDFWNSGMGMPWVDDVSDLTIEKFAGMEGPHLRGEVPKQFLIPQQEPVPFTPWICIVEADVQTYGLPWVVEVFDLNGNCVTVDHGIAGSFEDLAAVQLDYMRAAPRSFVIVDMSFADRRTETLEAINRYKARGWIAAEGAEVLKELTIRESANVYIGDRMQKSGIKVPKLRLSTYHLKVELEKRYAGELRKWRSYQLPLVATAEEMRDQKELYAQLLDEKKRPRKRRTAGKPPFEFVSSNQKNHFNDCKVYGLGLFIYLSKRETARRKKTNIKVKK